MVACIVGVWSGDQPLGIKGRGCLVLAVVEHGPVQLHCGSELSLLLLVVRHQSFRIADSV